MERKPTAAELRKSGYTLDRTLNTGNAPFGIRDYVAKLDARMQAGEIEDWRPVPVDGKNPVYGIYVKLRSQC